MTSAKNIFAKENEGLLNSVNLLKQEIKELKEKSDKDRTLFAQEQQNKRIQEQKLLQALDTLSRYKRQKSSSDEEIKAEYEGLRESLEKLQEKAEKIVELEQVLEAKNEEISSLKRKCKSLEREISLLQDEISL